MRAGHFLIRFFFFFNVRRRSSPLSVFQTIFLVCMFGLRSRRVAFTGLLAKPAEFLALQFPLPAIGLEHPFSLSLWG